MNILKDNDLERFCSKAKMVKIITEKNKVFICEGYQRICQSMIDSDQQYIRFDRVLSVDDRKVINDCGIMIDMIDSIEFVF